MERHAQSEREDQQHRRAPGAEVQHIGGGLVGRCGRGGAQAERGEEHRDSGKPARRSRRHHLSPQRRASARTLRNKPSSATLMKNPASDRKIEPVANGVKCTKSDRFTTNASNGSGSIQPKLSIIHSSRNRLSDSSAAMI